MTIRELAFELELGDIIDDVYVVEKIKSTVIEARYLNDKVKFCVGGKTGQYRKIGTVSRDGEVYYVRSSRGGYRHGERKLSNKEVI